MPIDWDKRVRVCLGEGLREHGWRFTPLPRIGPAYQKNGYAIVPDSVGIFLYQFLCGRWNRLHGLAYANMRSLLAGDVMTFLGGATINLQGDYTKPPEQQENT
jgi:hypothetical protein